MNSQLGSQYQNGTYVAFEMTTQSKVKLAEFVSNILPTSEDIQLVDPSTYHITIIYSKIPVFSVCEHLLNDHTFFVEATVTGYDIFSTKDDGICLVMKVKCPDATKLNSKMLAAGATSDYPYNPHVTLSYNIRKQVDIENLPLPKFNLTFDKIIVSELKK